MSDAVKLTPSMLRFAEDEISAGNFRSLEEVTEAAFALLRENSLSRDAVRAELGTLFAEMDAGQAIPTTNEEFERMVRASAARHMGQ